VSCLWQGPGPKQSNPSMSLRKMSAFILRITENPYTRHASGKVILKRPTRCVCLSRAQVRLTPKRPGPIFNSIIIALHTHNLYTDYCWLSAADFKLPDNLCTDYCWLSAADFIASRSSDLTGNERQNCNMNCMRYALFVSTMTIRFKGHFYIHTRLGRRLTLVHTQNPRSS
jgi:hypothetical protein